MNCLYGPFIIITKDDDDGKYDEMWEEKFPL